MNLHNKNIRIAFLASLLLTLIIPVFIPHHPIHFFIPFLIIVFYRKPFIICLWAALGSGLILDLLSSHSRIGLTAINYTLTTAILHHQRRHFFADSISTLPVMTFLFSVASTLLQMILLSIFEHPIGLSMEWIFKDLFLMPGFDALFAFLFFILPFFLFGKPPRKGEEYFS